MWISFIIAAFIALLTGRSYAAAIGATEYIFAKNVFENNSVASIMGCLTIFLLQL